MPSLIEGSVRTNHGILDVVASLHWIQDNISQFGGSTSNITLIGHQRGAALVQFLMKSQLSKGEKLIFKNCWTTGKPLLASFSRHNGEEALTRLWPNRDRENGADRFYRWGVRSKAPSFRRCGERRIIRINDVQNIYWHRAVVRAALATSSTAQ